MLVAAGEQGWRRINMHAMHVGVALCRPSKVGRVTVRERHECAIVWQRAGEIIDHRHRREQVAVDPFTYPAARTLRCSRVH